MGESLPLHDLDQLIEDLEARTAEFRLPDPPDGGRLSHLLCSVLDPECRPRTVLGCQ
ncbi:hypothetical protein [Streptoalloteichus hindustanus]|uniref:Uncharacterized protein n=1 Tax=Streptoalloteichus hindustanus TaxID=2017 RepID=A0A1M5JTD8_STRHI|nr:hypothetical protein [Streptoalloteichus hindustanus]SHG43814.1 hypothetical protein SAMN05444320_10928 [Streptoalloteichus hindustanus]